MDQNRIIKYWRYRLTSTKIIAFEYTLKIKYLIIDINNKIIILINGK